MGYISRSPFKSKRKFNQSPGSQTPLHQVDILSSMSLLKLFGLHEMTFSIPAQLFGRCIKSPNFVILVSLFPGMFVYGSLAGRDHLRSQISPLLTPLLVSVGLRTHMVSSAREFYCIGIGKFLNLVFGIVQVVCEAFG